MKAEIIEEAKKDLKRARNYHQNFLARRERESSKAGEHLWSCISSLPIGVHGLEIGKGVEARTPELGISLRKLLKILKNSKVSISGAARTFT